MWGSGTKAVGGGQDDFRIERKDGCALVYVPFRREFVYGIRELGIGAKWNGNAWSVPEGSVEAVRALMEEFFGRTDLPDDSRIVTVRVTVTEELSEEHGPICLFGRVIASAGGRDSGAKVGSGVSFIKGYPRSGGSRQYWKTLIPAGAVFDVDGIHESVIPKGTVPYERRYATYRKRTGEIVWERHRCGGSYTACVADETGIVKEQ